MEVHHRIVATFHNRHAPTAITITIMATLRCQNARIIIKTTGITIITLLPITITIIITNMFYYLFIVIVSRILYLLFIYLYIYIIAYLSFFT